VAEPKREEEQSIFGGRARAGGDESPEREDDAPPTGGRSGSNGDAGNAEAVSEEIKKLRAEKEELTQMMVRRQADFENFRKRTERDRSEEARRGVERMMGDLVPVLDAFDRALQTNGSAADDEYSKGVLLIRKQLADVLARQGLQRVEAAGKVFDPHLHQAINRVDSADLPDGTIMEVFQDGYMFHGRVLRPAIVSVAVHPGDDMDSEADSDPTEN